MKQYKNLTSLDNFASSILKRHKWTVVSTQKIQFESFSNSMLAYCILNANHGSEEDWDYLTVARTASPLDEIFGIVADCASLLRDLTASLSLLSPVRELTLQELLQHCAQIEELQESWYSRNSKDFSPSASQQSTVDNPLFSRNLAFGPHEFGSLDAAKTYCLFCISTIVIKRAIYQIQKQLRGASDPQLILSSAREICLTVAFCMKPDTQMSAGHLALFAISQASKGYIDCRHLEMFNWCQYVYSILQSQGIGLAGRVSKEDLAVWNLVGT